MLRVHKTFPVAQWAAHPGMKYFLFASLIAETPCLQALMPNGTENAAMIASRGHTGCSETDEALPHASWP